MSILEKKRMNHPRWDESELPDYAVILEPDECFYMYRSHCELRRRTLNTDFGNYEYLVVASCAGHPHEKA